MDQHIKIVGYIHIVLSVIAFVGCLALFLLFAGGMTAAGIHENDIKPIFISGVIGIIFMIIACVSIVPGFFAGYGLLKGRSYGRMLSIIMGVIYLFMIPIGTIFGVYSLWVLLNDESKVKFS